MTTQTTDDARQKALEALDAMQLWVGTSDYTENQLGQMLWDHQETIRAALMQMTGWQPIETAPRDETEISKELHLDLWRKFDALAKENIELRAALQSKPAVQEMTVEEFSRHIQMWKFLDQYDGSFGDYLADTFPNGFRIVPEKKQGEP